MSILLRESEIARLVTIKAALEVVERAFVLHAKDEAQNAPRRRCRVEKGLLHVMSAAVPSMGVAGLKSYMTVAGHSRFHMLLYSAETGELLAVMEDLPLLRMLIDTLVHGRPVSLAIDTFFGGLGRL
jgi:ornithine cyclodeaminase/alanine dehydrogenase-like protein (mu-crystallin family)